VRDFIRIGGRGRVHDPNIGCSTEVADRLEQWFIERACDGFVVSATHVPGAYEDFVRFVVLKLLRRRLCRKEYVGKTLRENLGLPIPRAGAWRRTYAGTNF
jgi:hypothetical protein